MWMGAVCGAWLAALTFSGSARGIEPTAQALAERVTIYRDSYGMPHIDGEDDEATLFGFAYCQAEDYFWQIEESYVMGLGRFAELYGKKVLGKDVLNRAFEIPQRSQADFANLDAETQRLCLAFTAGLNYYLDTHPEVKPRLLKRFEPWYMVAFGRAATLELAGSHMHAPTGNIPEGFADSGMGAEIRAAIGSNAWALAPARTRDKRAMLLINPHQPYYGFGQFYEAHLRSGTGWDFSGATFFGSPLPTLGHNAHCGWAFTTNEPSVGSSWVETFDDPANKLNYRYGDGYRQATEWKDKLKFKKGNATEEVEYTFRKTHHGPILHKRDETHYVSGMVGKLYDAILSRQSLKMIKSKNLDEFRAAMAMVDLPIFNTTYADVHGNIYYLYNGIIPKRDPSFDWNHPVDGSDPKTEWQGFHTIDELPQVLNPVSGFIQNCNSTPFTTTDDGNPALGDFPAYMVGEKHDDKRRAKVSRMLLREMQDVTYDDWQSKIFDTTVYWAVVELPVFERKWQALSQSDPTLAAQVEPYLKHLLDWDKRGSLESTQATLCLAWYEELYGFGYPAETLKRPFIGNPAEQLKALVTAAEKLKAMFGDWRVAWGEVNRLQRHTNVSDFYAIPFNDTRDSLPSAGMHGPPGVVFTMYFTPSVNLPPLKLMKKHYAVVGTSYLAAIEFGSPVQSKALVQYGASSDPKSPHFFDQAALLSKQQLKPSLFAWDEIRQQAKRTYRPGQETPAIAAGK